MVSLIPFFVMVVPPPVVTSDAWVGSKTTVPAEATPQISVNKDNHTNRNALFIIVCIYGTPDILASWVVSQMAGHPWLIIK